MQVNNTNNYSQYVVEQKFNYKMNANNKSNSSITETQIIEFKRYLQDDTFAIKTNFKSNLSLSKYLEGIQINNKEFGNSDSQNYEYNKSFIFSPTFLKNYNFSDVKTFAHYFHNVNNYQAKLHFLATLKIEKTKIENSFQVKNEYIHFKIPKIIKFYYEKNSDSYDPNIFFYNYEISYNNIILFPVKLQENKFNETLYYVSIFNDDKEVTDRDFGLEINKLKNAPIENNEQLSLIYNNMNTEKYIGEYLINGKIDILDETYYEDGKIKKGIFHNSQKGLFIPDNFNTSFNSIINLSLNKSWKNVNLGFYNEFKNIENSEKLNLFLEEINDVESAKVVKDFFEIKKDLFLKIIQANFTLDKIKNLGYKKNEYNF